MGLDRWCQRPEGAGLVGLFQRAEGTGVRNLTGGEH